MKKLQEQTDPEIPVVLTGEERINYINENQDKIKQFSQYDKLDASKIGDFYNDFASTYEELTVKAGFNDFEHVARAVDKHAKSKDVEILDFGAGTGLVGRILKGRGFGNLHAIDGSDKMIEELQKFGSYVKSSVLLIGKDKLPDGYEGRFDYALGSGVFSMSHFPKEAIDEFYKSLKVGGLMIFSMREKYLDPEETTRGYGRKLKEYLDGGLLEEVDRIPFVKYEGNTKDKMFSDVAFVEAKSNIMVLRKSK